MEVIKGYWQTEAGVIPADWELMQLKDIASYRRGSFPQPYGLSKWYDDMLGRPFVQVFDVDDNMKLKPETKKYISKVAEEMSVFVEKGSVVVTINGSVGRIALTQYDAFVDRTLLIFKNFFEPINKKYFAYSVFAVFQREKVKAPGAILKTITKEHLSSFLLPVPPLHEQRAIASALSDVDELITSLDKLIAKKRLIKQGAMQELLTGKRRLPGFSGEWDVTRFGNIVQQRKERINPRSSARQDFCIELENIEHVTGKISGNSTITESLSLKSVFYKDDVLFGKLRAYLRKYWLAERDGVCSTEIWVLVAKSSELIPKFLFQLVKMERFVEAASIAYGTHMPRSDWNIVKNSNCSGMKSLN